MKLARIILSVFVMMFGLLGFYLFINYDTKDLAHAHKENLANPSPASKANLEKAKQRNVRKSTIGQIISAAIFASGACFLVTTVRKKNAVATNPRA